VVIDDRFDWEDDKAPKTPYHKSVIYETHVKGFTQLHPGIPEEIRGTYAAMGHPVTIAYLRELGVTAVELMPVHHFITDRYLLDKGLTNYWGYNSIGFFAPDVRYSGSGTLGGQVTEFKEMVKALHKAGIEVILDVVYNHTGEGNQMGPRCRSRASTTPRTTGWWKTRNATTWTTPARATPSTPTCPRAPAHHGQPALLDPGHARGRLPL
jgi:glycogen operon protein